MNERIRELATEVGISVEYLNNTKQWVLIEALSMLIVRECEKVISDGRFSDMACEGNSHRISYNNGRYGASSDIKKHFGVEE